MLKAPSSLFIGCLLLVSFSMAQLSSGIGDPCNWWCVAWDFARDEDIRAAMQWACTNGGDCSPLLPNGPCYRPNDLYSMASYAINDYWQKNKRTVSCSWSNATTVVFNYPGYDNCQFICLP